MNTTDQRRKTTDPESRTITFVTVGIVLPVLATIASICVQVAQLPELPDRIAMHWNSFGEPDQWTAPWVAPVLTATLGLGVPALLTIPVIVLHRSGMRSVPRRLAATVSAATTTAVAYLTAATLVSQTDDGTAPVGSLLGIAAAVFVSVGLAAWAVLPPDAERAAGSTAPLAVTPDERVGWLSTEVIDRRLAALIVVCAATPLAVLMVAGVRDPAASLLTPSVVALIAVLLVAATATGYHVRIDQRGLTVRSILGFPRFRVASSDVASVDAMPVSAVGEFGGYGIRLRKGALGVILRNGPAMEVTRRNGRRFVVSIRNAETAAAVLATVADRAA